MQVHHDEGVGAARLAAILAVRVSAISLSVSQYHRFANKLDFEPFRIRQELCRLSLERLPW